MKLWYFMGLHIFLNICPDVFLEMVGSEIWRTSREKNKVEFSFHQVEVASYKFIMHGILIFVYLNLKLFHSKTVWKHILSIIDMFIFCLFILKLKFSIKRLFRARTSLTLIFRVTIHSIRVCEMIKNILWKKYQENVILS